MFSIRSVSCSGEDTRPRRWAFGIDPRLRSRDVTRREDKRRERERERMNEGDVGTAGEAGREIEEDIAGILDVPANIYRCPSLSFGL